MFQGKGCCIVAHLDKAEVLAIYANWGHPLETPENYRLTNVKLKQGQTLKLYGLYLAKNDLKKTFQRKFPNELV